VIFAGVPSKWLYVNGGIEPPIFPFGIELIAFSKFIP
jgi:hypothetical protein